MASVFSSFTAPSLIIHTLLMIGSLHVCWHLSESTFANALPVSLLPHHRPIPPVPKCSTRIVRGRPLTTCAPLGATKKTTAVRLPAKTPAPRKSAPVVVHRPPAVRRPGGGLAAADNLSNDYYATSCPNVESIIHNKVVQWVNLDQSLAASLLRLHFHDCMVTGNDASILLEDPRGRSTEMYSVLSKGLRGFNVVDDIKLAVEKECPGIVSCADTLSVIAREVTLLMGGPFWFVPFGRKDSLTSHIEDAAQLPHQASDANALQKQFEAVGLSFSDLATLSGAHSVGKSHCFSFAGGGAAGANRRINATYAKILLRECAPGPWEEVFNDPDTPMVLDLQYYTNLKRGMGLFRSDDSLYRDNPLTSSMVDAFLTQPGMWDAQFAVSMVKLGNVNVLFGPHQGEIRRVCSVRNPVPPPH